MKDVISMNGPTHTVGSHSDDRGGESDCPYYDHKHSNSKSEDTSLDDILDQFVQPGTKYLKDVQADIMAWHKAEIAKLLQVIEDEVDKHDPSTGRATSKAYWGNTLRQALKKIKDNVINGGSL